MRAIRSRRPVSSRKIDYGYDLYPDRPGVALTLTLVDEVPLLPARIRPESEESELWSSLQSLDRLFTQELPRTEKALNFYAANIERCLKAKGRDNEYAASSVVGDQAGNAGAISFFKYGVTRLVRRANS
jgi:hypothetical protein